MERVTLGQLPFTAAQVRETIFDGRDGTFGPWKHRLVRRLAKLKLDHCLIRTPLEEACLVDLGDAKVEEAKKELYRKRINEDVEALDEIVMAVSNDVLNHIIGVDYAKEAMDVLIREYQKEGTGCLIAMRGRLQHLKDRKFADLSELFYNYDIIVRELDRLGAGISSSERIHSLMLAIPEKYSHVQGALTVLSNDELCRKPISEIKRIFLDAEMAMMDGKRREERSGPPNVALKTYKKPATKCFGCGESGHYKNRCPKRTRKGRNGHAAGRYGGHAMVVRVGKPLKHAKLAKLARAAREREPNRRSKQERERQQERIRQQEREREHQRGAVVDRSKPRTKDADREREHQRGAVVDRSKPRTKDADRERDVDRSKPKTRDADRERDVDRSKPRTRDTGRERERVTAGSRSTDRERAMAACRPTKDAEHERATVDRRSTTSDAAARATIARPKPSHKDLREKLGKESRQAKSTPRERALAAGEAAEQ